MKKLLGTTSLLTGALGILGLVTAPQALATASQTQTGKVDQDKINLQQDQAKAQADQQVSASKDAKNADKGAIIADKEKLQSDEQKNLEANNDENATLATEVEDEAKLVGAKDRKKAKTIALIDQKLAQKATVAAQKNAQIAADKGEAFSKKANRPGGKADPAALYCVKVGGHAHIRKGITGKEVDYCYLPNNVSYPADKIYQMALKGKGTIAPTKSATHLTKEQKQDITDARQQGKKDKAEKQSYEQRQAAK